MFLLSMWRFKLVTDPILKSNSWIHLIFEWLQIQSMVDGQYLCAQYLALANTVDKSRTNVVWSSSAWDLNMSMIKQSLKAELEAFLSEGNWMVLLFPLTSSFLLTNSFFHVPRVGRRVSGPPPHNNRKNNKRKNKLYRTKWENKVND